MFRPNLPEAFTSPGPVIIYFDTNNNRLATPQLRLKPDIAAADGANNTFFPLAAAEDVPWDIDNNYANFYGTSAASPHSAAVAALILEAHKPAILTPQQVKTIMQLTAFPHDLDPFFVSGNATAHDGAVTVNVTSDDDSNAGTGANDTNGWKVIYTGSGYVKELHFNPNGLAAEGGNVSGGNYIGGAATGTPVEYSDFLTASNYHSTPGMVFNSNQYVNGTHSDVTGTATFSNPPAVTFPGGNAYNWTLNITFPASSFIAGKTFSFNAGRAQQQDARVPQGFTFEEGLFGQSDSYCADILGSGILIPEYADNPVISPGMVFSGIITDGGTDYPFTGRLTNKVGHGYSRLDGFGFLNAEAAVTATLPVPGVASRKTHNTAGTFDTPLPVNGTAGIECRAPGPNQSFTLIFTFDRPVANSGNAGVSQGTGSVTPNPDNSTAAIGSNPNEIVVNLQGVTNAQHLVVTLSGVQDTSGNTFASVPARMDVLLGDVNASGRVDGGDIGLVRQQNFQTLGSSNFREDIDVSGRIDGGDVSIARQQNFTHLP